MSTPGSSHFFLRQHFCQPGGTEPLRPKPKRLQYQRPHTQQRCHGVDSVRSHRALTEISRFGTYVNRLNEADSGTLATKCYPKRRSKTWHGLGRMRARALRNCRQIRGLNPSFLWKLKSAGPGAPHRCALIVSTRIVGRRTAPCTTFLIPDRVPRDFTQDPSTDQRVQRLLCGRTLRARPALCRAAARRSPCSLAAAPAPAAGRRRRVA